MKRPRKTRNRVRLLRATLILGTLLGGGSFLSWRVWLARLPRPDLLEFVPSNAQSVVHLKNLPEALRRMKYFDKQGALLGPDGLVRSVLARLPKGLSRMDVFKEVARDEILAAELDGSEFLIVSRLGAREQIADTLAQEANIVAVRRSGGHKISTVRISKDATLSYSLTQGVVVLSTSEGIVRRALEGPSLSSAARNLIHPLAEDFHLRLLLRDRVKQRPRGLPPWAKALTLQLKFGGRLRHPVSPRVRGSIFLQCREQAAPWFKGTAENLYPEKPESFELFPEESILVVEAGNLDPFWQGIDPENLGLPPSLEIKNEIERFRGASAALALIEVAHGGPVPIPQAVLALTGPEGGLSDGFLGALEKVLQEKSNGHLKMEKNIVDKFTVRTVNMPVTNTLGPSLATVGRVQLLATSLKAMKQTLGVVRGRNRAHDPSRFEVLQMPAHGFLMADLPAITAEGQKLVEGLRAFRLLRPETEKFYVEEGQAWLAALASFGDLAASAELLPSGLSMEFECRLR